MSLANGLIYTYTKPKGPAATDPWYFTAVEFSTGKTVWEIAAGLGVLYNNHYAGAYIGPDGTLYVGVLGGIVALRDGK
jgi:outer membrane protein assembly factor BamB